MGATLLCDGSCSIVADRPASRGAAQGCAKHGSGLRLPPQGDGEVCFADTDPSRTPPAAEDAGKMPQFQIEGEAEIFDAADEIDVQGEIACYSFVTAEKSPNDDATVIISPVQPKDLAGFEGLLFQIDVDEEEDLVILRQVQMFFWPWEDDEEFEDADSVDDEGGGG
jgi:hypothetical protein